MLNDVPVCKISTRKLELCYRTLQNFFQNHSQSHSMPTGWAKNGTVLFNCLHVVALLLLLTSVSRHLHTVLLTFLNKNVEKIKKR